MQQHILAPFSSHYLYYSWSVLSAHTKNEVRRNEMSFIAYFFVRGWHLSSPFYLCKTHFWKFNRLSGKGLLIPLKKAGPNDEIQLCRVINTSY